MKQKKYIIHVKADVAYVIDAEREITAVIA